MLAAVPQEAWGRIKQFQNEEAKFAPNAEVIDKILRTDVGRFLKKTTFTGEHARRYANVARVEYLWWQMNDGFDGRFKSRKRQHKKELERLNKQIADVHTEAKMLLNYEKNALREMKQKPGLAESTLAWPADLDDLEKLTLDDDETKLFSAQPEKIREFTEQEAQLLQRYEIIYKALVRIAVTTTLACSLREDDRRVQLKSLGFCLTGPVRKWNLVSVAVPSVCASLVVIGVPTFFYWLVALGGFIEERSDIAIWTATGVVMHTLAICAALVLSGTGRRMGGVNERVPVILGGSIAGFASSIYLFTILSLAHERAELLAQGWGWALLPAVTGAFMALHLMLPPMPRHRVLGVALLQGVLTMIVAALVTFFVAPEGEEIVKLVIFGLYAAATALLTGTALGLLFPLYVHPQLRWCPWTRPPT